MIHAYLTQPNSSHPAAPAGRRQLPRAERSEARGTHPGLLHFTPEG